MSSPIYKPTTQASLPAKKKVHELTTMVVQDDVDTRCGFWMYKPAKIQPCARIGVFAAFYSLAALMTSTLSSYVNSQVTTLERQFGFSSHQTGIILAANDIGYLVCVLFVGYWTSRIHIPRSLGVATITFGISGIACSLPHFLFGATVNIDPTTESDNNTVSLTGLGKQSAVFGTLCETSNNTEDACAIAAAKRLIPTSDLAPEQIVTVSLVIIVIGMAMQGFGKAPRMAFTITYVDDNTAKVNTGFYVGIITAMGILGPAVAFLMGGVFSGMYVTLKETKLTPRHPKWIGAWWLGYIVFGLVALIIAIPLFCFPRRLPRKGSRENDKEEQKIKGTDSLDITTVHKHSTKPSEELQEVSNKQYDQKPSIAKRLNPKFLLRHARDFLASLFRLVSNPIYVCIVFSTCSTVFSISGSHSYTPKYLERMFHLPTRQANYVIAIQTLCTSCLGTFIGGYLSKRLRMNAMTGIKFNVGCISVAAFAQLMGFVFQCDQPTVHNWPSDESSCNNGCNCPNNSYFPICGGDGKTYYSPCHAGCAQVEQGVYENCSCIVGGLANSGTCDYNCIQMYPYAIFIGLKQMFVTLAIVPKLIVLIRCVSEQDRSMCLALSTFMSSMLGWLLGPIVFGNVIDTVCTIWDIECDVRGRCLHYDNNLFRIKLHGYCSASLGLSAMFLSTVYIYARCTKRFEEPEAAKAEVAGSHLDMPLGVNGDSLRSDFAVDEIEQQSAYQDQKKSEIKQLENGGV